MLKPVQHAAKDTEEFTLGSLIISAAILYLGLFGTCFKYDMNQIWLICLESRIVEVIFHTSIVFTPHTSPITLHRFLVVLSPSWPQNVHHISSSIHHLSSFPSDFHPISGEGFLLGRGGLGATSRDDDLWDVPLQGAAGRDVGKGQDGGDLHQSQERCEGTARRRWVQRKAVE